MATLHKGDNDDDDNDNNNNNSIYKYVLPRDVSLNSKPSLI
jgi:hypothetical protein